MERARGITYQTHALGREYLQHQRFVELRKYLDAGFQPPSFEPLTASNCDRLLAIHLSLTGQLEPRLILALVRMLSLPWTIIVLVWV
jgi:hypothetical protein